MTEAEEESKQKRPSTALKKPKIEAASLALKRPVIKEKLFRQEDNHNNPGRKSNRVRR